MRFALGLALALFVAGPAAGDPLNVHDDRLKFSAVIPDGFSQLPEVRGFVVYAFGRDRHHPERDLTIQIAGTGVRLLPGAVTEEERAELRAKAPGAEVFTARWKDRDVDVVKAVTADEMGHHWVTYAAGVPLDPEAVQVVVSGPEGKDAEARDVFMAVLRGLDGTPSEMPPPPGLRVKRKYALLLLIVVLAAAWWGWRRVRQPRAPRPRV